MSEIESPIPKRLKSARTKAGLTQKELGVRIGIKDGSASGYINHYEKGRHTPSIETLSKLAVELSMPLNYFLCENDLDAEMSYLMTTFEAEVKASVVDIVKSLSELRGKKKGV